MTYQAKRRRGPNKPKPIAEALPPAINAGQPVQTEDAPQAAVTPSRRRKRADVGGQHLRLKVPEREGYHRRWVNDNPGRIAMFQELAYDHVTETGIKSDSPDSRVRRLVGTQAGGAPQYAYLMETPQAEFQGGVEEKEEARRSFEDAIRRGEDTLGQPITTQVQSHTSSIR